MGLLDKKDKKETAVAKKEDSAVAIAGAFEEDAGAGFEDTNAEDFAIPFLKLLQSLSPAVDEDDEAYIDGAKAGDFLETVSEDVFSGKDGLSVIPCYYRRAYVKWAPRETGGGFMGELDPGDPAIKNTTRNAKGEDIDAEGNIIQDTRMFYLLIIHPVTGLPVPAILSLASTQLKKARQWMTKMNNIKLEGKKGLFTPPSYSHIYKLTTIGEENAKGKWKGLKVETEGPITDADLYATAKEFHTTIKAGGTRPAYDEATKEDGGDDAPF